MHRAFMVAGACLATAGCLLNAVSRVSVAPRAAPDRWHALVVIGMGLETAWPYKAYSLTLVEYSQARQRTTGNCFLYNRISAQRAATTGPVHYLVFEVPANTYSYLGSRLSSRVDAVPGKAFIAPPGGIVYFGDYVTLGRDDVEFRRDVDAARAATRTLLPPGAILQPAPATDARGATMPLCTP